MNRTPDHTISFFSCTLVLATLLGALLFSGCNPTRYIPDDSYLLNKNKLEIDNKNLPKKEIESMIKQKPNKRIIGMRFHLFLYNLSNINKKNWFQNWLRSIGEEPVILDQGQLQRSVNQLKLYMRNKGYYHAIVKDSIATHKKKAEVIYQVKTNNPFIINRMNYLIHDTSLVSIVLKDTVNSLLHNGNLFDADVMQNERLRIENLLKNNGYYGFSKEFILFNADTSSENNKVNLEIEIRNYTALNADKWYTEIPHPRYKIKDIYVYTEYDPKLNITHKMPEEVMFKTSQFDSIHFIYYGKPYIKPRIINQSIYIQKGKYFVLNDVDKTYLHLSSLRSYKFVDISFDDPNAGKYAIGSDRLLDCRIKLSPLNKQSYEVKVETTNSSGIFGVAGDLIYSHKNFFRGAEIMDISVKGGIEAGKEKYLQQIGSMLEFGVSANLRIPQFWLPFRTEQFIKKFSPKTNISIAHDFQRRPDYTRTIASITFGYTWRGNPYLTHVLNPIELNAVKIFSIDSSFMTDINENPYLAYSYQDHFVSVSSYSLIYSNQNLSKIRDFIYFRLNLESAGNVMSGIYSILHIKKEDGTYHLFGLEYSQFVRADFDLRYYKIINKTDKIVFRIFAGAGLPYGNSKAIPFEKRYFSGGFNSIRAWAPRELGPGSYRSDQKMKFPNNTGDMKLEGNAEYRFKLIWVLEGALFADAGNVWAITSNDTRPGALFKWNTFANDIAVGLGIGLRFDFSFFIFSADLGFKTRDPSFSGNKWLPYDPFTTNAYALNVGIGYPF